jgi:hypothetical protein
MGAIKVKGGKSSKSSKSSKPSKTKSDLKGRVVNGKNFTGSKKVKLSKEKLQKIKELLSKGVKRGMVKITSTVRIS